MRRAILMIAALAAMALSVPVSGQVAGRGNSVPRTPDGQPDLQGFWTNDTVTPLERPAEFGSKEFLTAEEAAAYAKKRNDQFLAQPKDNIHYDDAIWQAENYSKDVRLRTSLVTDPRDGKLPPLTPEARKREAARVANRAGTGVSDSAQTRSLAERCISWGNVGPPMIPPTYYANFQILQSRDTVVIRHELMHDTRIIYLDGHAHPSSAIQYLAGHSRGRWEGDTLVVDDHQLHRPDELPRASRDDAAGDQPHAVAARDRAVHAHRQEHHPLRIYGGGPGDMDQAVVR